MFFLEADFFLKIENLSIFFLFYLWMSSKLPGFSFLKIRLDEEEVQNLFFKKFKLFLIELRDDVVFVLLKICVLLRFSPTSSDILFFFKAKCFAFFDR